ncbi:MAG: hypothetical protein WA431_14325 [Candidatus Cybelea sp.]
MIHLRNLVGALIGAALLAACGSSNSLSSSTPLSVAPQITAPQSAAAGSAPTTTNATQAARSTRSCLTSFCIYVFNCVSCGNSDQVGSILIYPSSGTGNIKPVEKLTGSHIRPYYAFAVDPNHNVYVANKTRIEMFAAGKYGAVKPQRVISGSLTGLRANSIAVDSNGKIYSENTYYGNDCSQYTPSNVTVYSAGSHGNVPPIAEFGTYDGVRVAVDASGNVYTLGGCSQGVNVYAPSGSSYVLVQNISGSNTGLSGAPPGITVDPNKNIWVTTGSDLLMFAAGSSGNVSPSIDITGPNTGLSATGVAVDSFGNSYAANGNTPASVTVYPPGSNGNALPTQGIVGKKTKLTEPVAIVVR